MRVALPRPPRRAVIPTIIAQRWFAPRHALPAPQPQTEGVAVEPEAAR